MALKYRLMVVNKKTKTTVVCKREPSEARIRTEAMRYLTTHGETCDIEALDMETGKCVMRYADRGV